MVTLSIVWNMDESKDIQLSNSWKLQVQVHNLSSNLKGLEVELFMNNNHANALMLGVR